MQGLVTVFGGSGFVGRYAVQALARAGWRIRVAVREPHLAPFVTVPGSVGQVHAVQANVRVADSVQRALEGAEACVNLVGVLAELGKQRFDAVHADAAGTIARLAAAEGCRAMVQVSAIGADPASASTYARSKGLGEQAVAAAFPHATVLRPSIVFGPEDDFFNRFGRLAQIAPALPLIGGGRTRFQPVFAGDVGRAIAACLEPVKVGLQPVGRTYELGGPGVYSFRELMELIRRETERRPALVDLPFPAARLIGRVGDLQAKLLPLFPPQLTSDQVTLLETDNVAHPGVPGLPELGMEPTALEAVLPTYLWKFRRGGQYAQPETLNAASG